MLKQHLPFLILPWVSFWSSLMLKALLWSVFGRVRIGVELQRWNATDERKKNKKTQMVKYVVEQKYCSFSLLTKEKIELFWFDFLPDARLVSPLLCSDCMWILERGRVCAMCCSAIDCMKPVCVCESEGVCVVVTGQWCACSDCILWPSALNK